MIYWFWLLTNAISKMYNAQRTNLNLKRLSRKKVGDVFQKWLPIFGSHVKRIGLLRTSIGGFPMYLSVPAFVLFHLFGLAIFSNIILKPIFNLEKLRFRDFIIIDRYKISGLPWFDRINCMYCGYANGICTIFEARLNQMARWRGKISNLQWLILTIGLIAYFPAAAIFRLQRFFVYDLIISYPLGLNKTSSIDAEKQIEKHPSSATLPRLAKFILHHERVLGIKVRDNLEQIESSWCPIKHLDIRDGVIYPKHHQNFLNADEIEIMKSILQSTGTVSPRRPYR